MNTTTAPSIDQYLPMYPDMPEWARAKFAEFLETLPTMTNQDLVDASASAVLAAAVMNGRRSDSGLDDAKASACMDEARRRGNSDLYQRGFNSAVRSQGHTDMVRKVTIPIGDGDPTVAAQ